MKSLKKRWRKLGKFVKNNQLQLITLVQVLTIVLGIITAWIQISEMDLLQKEYKIFSQEFQIANKPKIDVSFVKTDYIMSDSREQSCLHRFDIENYGNTIAYLNNVTILANDKKNEKYQIVISGDKTKKLLPGRKSVVDMERIIAENKLESKFPDLNEIPVIYVDISYEMHSSEKTEENRDYTEFCDSFQFIISSREPNNCNDFSFVWENVCGPDKTW